MQILRLLVCSFVCFSLLWPSRARQTATPNTASTSLPPQRDSQALTLLQQSIAAMSSSAPFDSSASGSITIVEGSRIETGAIQILTRGTSQTSETLIFPDRQRIEIYSNGAAKQSFETGTSNSPLESIVTQQCPDFPLPFLTALINNPDEALVYVGQDFVNGIAVQHIQTWNTFNSQPNRQNLAAFSTREVWLNTQSGLPVKIAYSRRTAGGTVPAIPMEIWYSDFRNVGGVLYAFQINKVFNGVPWQTITIQSVLFNSGLTDAQFQVE